MRAAARWLLCVKTDFIDRQGHGLWSMPLLYIVFLPAEARERGGEAAEAAVAIAVIAGVIILALVLLLRLSRIVALQIVRIGQRDGEVDGLVLGDAVDEQIRELNARLAECSTALLAAQETARAAQALHAGTMQQQLAGGEDRASADVPEDRAAPKGRSWLSRFFRR